MENNDQQLGVEPTIEISFASQPQQTVRDLSVLGYEDLGLEAIVPSFVGVLEETDDLELEVNEGEKSVYVEEMEQLPNSLELKVQREESYSNLNNLYKKLKAKQAILVSI